MRIPEKTKTGDYLVADSLPALIGLVQMDVLEIHTWNSTVERLEHPDRIVLDLDRVRGRLDRLSLDSFVKTTGGRGLHVVVPIAPKHEWQECLAFARRLAEDIAGEDSESYTTVFARKGRERKILIDYLRNNRTNTSVAAFSTRARARAPVSVPLRWEELSAEVPSDAWTVETLPSRLKRLRRDPWEDYWKSRRRLPIGRRRP